MTYRKSEIKKKIYIFQILKQKNQPKFNHIKFILKFQLNSGKLFNFEVDKVLALFILQMLTNIIEI